LPTQEKHGWCVTEHVTQEIAVVAFGNTIQEQLAALEGELERQRMSPTGVDESVRQADAMQVTPPHQRSTFGDPSMP
jgi:hypothetical protein